jgi:hypothetical protein
MNATILYKPKNKIKKTSTQKIVVNAAPKDIAIILNVFFTTVRKLKSSFTFSNIDLLAFE